MNIYRILAIAFPNATAFKGARVLNTLYALELGADPFQIGMLLAAYALFPLLLALYVGRLADRYGVSRPLAIGLSGMALGVFLPFLFPVLPALFVAALLTGAGFIFFQVSMQTLVGSLGAGEQRTRNVNLFSLAVASADFAGPVLAGFLIDAAGHVRTYAWLAVLNLLALALLARLFDRVPRSAHAAQERGAERMADLVRDAALRRAFAAGAVVFVGIDLFQLYLPLYGRSIGLSASAIGMVLGAFAAAAFVTRALLPVTARRFGEHRALTGALYLSAATFVAIPFVTEGVALAAVAFVLGLGLGLGQPLSVILTCNASPPGRMGEALGLRITLNNVVHIVAPSAFGAVGALFGLGPIFWITAAMLALGSYAGRARD